MVLYTCRRCGYSNKIKTHMKKHFMRQTVCSPSNENISINECYEEIFGNNSEKVNESKCFYPEKVNESKCFSNKSKCLVNESKCFVNESKCSVNVFYCRSCNKQFNSKQGRYQHEKKFCKGKDSYTKEEVAEAKQEIENKLLEIVKNKDEIISELKTQIEKLLTKVGNTTNNNTYNTIVINAFGKENMGYIKGGFIKELITRGPYSAIPKLLQEIHFNPDHSENHNLTEYQECNYST